MSDIDDVLKMILKNADYTPQELAREKIEFIEALGNLTMRVEYLLQTGVVDVNKSETLRDLMIAQNLIKKATQ